MSVARKVHGVMISCLRLSLRLPFSLSFSLSVCLPVCLSACLPVCLPVCLRTRASTDDRHLWARLPAYLDASPRLSASLSGSMRNAPLASLSVCRSVGPSVHLSVCVRSGSSMFCLVAHGGVVWQSYHAIHGLLP